MLSKRIFSDSGFNLRSCQIHIHMCQKMLWLVCFYLWYLITDRIYFYNKSFAVRHLFKVCKLWTVANDDDDYAATTASLFTPYCVLIFVILMAIHDFSSFPSVSSMIFCNNYHNLPQQTSCVAHYFS